MEEHGGRRWPLVVLTASPLQGHMTPTLQLATALHSKGFSIAIAHSKLNPPDPSNHPSDFIFLPLSDNLSAIDDSGSFSNFITTLNNSSKPLFKEHLTRLMSEQNRGKESIVVIYDFLMFFAADVAVDLNIAAILFRSCSAAYFPAFLVRLKLRQQSRFLEQGVRARSSTPQVQRSTFFKIAYRRLEKTCCNFYQQARPSAIIWNTIKSLEQEPLTHIHQHYQVPVFAIGPLHKITPSPPTSFYQEDTGCVTWLDKQDPKYVLYISFGSLVTFDSKLLTEMALGLANSHQRFLWAVRPGSVCGSEWLEFLPKGFLEETRERGLIVKWAPQKQVLAHFAVGGFWSHCGWNSTLESISEGVPMICQPDSVDQGVNARYVSYVWKIGLELERFERGEIDRMIRRIMVDEEGEEIRVRVTNMKRMVEKAVKNNGSSQDSLQGLVNFILSR